MSATSYQPGVGAASPAEQPVRSGGRVWLWTKRVVGGLALVAVTVAVLGLAVVTIGPRLFPYQALVVRSGSMSPTIPTGSIVFYRPVQASAVRVGDVIVFNEPGNTGIRVTHRVAAIQRTATGSYFKTKGDANASIDDWRIPATGTGWKEVFSVPEAGYILYDIQSRYGKLVFLLVPAALLAAITMLELWDARKKDGSAA